MYIKHHTHIYMYFSMREHNFITHLLVSLSLLEDAERTKKKKCTKTFQIDFRKL